MKHLELFENFNSNIYKSKLPKDLYNELLPLFEPKYNLERPSGHSLEVIEMKFNNIVKYEDVIDIILDANWYVVEYYKDGGVIIRIDIRPKYSRFIENDYPKIVYHISPSSNDTSIKNNGIRPLNSKKKGINFPPRIYVVSDLESFSSFQKELNYYINEKDWTIWEINLFDLGIDFLYVDETVSQNLNKPIAFYLQEINIPKENIRVKKRIEI